MIESPMSSPSRQYVVITSEGTLRFKLPESLPVNNVTSAIRYIDKYIPPEVSMEMCVPYENEATFERFKDLPITTWELGKPVIQQAYIIPDPPELKEVEVSEDDYEDYEDYEDYSEDFDFVE